MRTKRSVSLILFIFLFVTLACSLPQSATPTPFVFPTPDYTLTAVFEGVAPLPTIEYPATETVTSLPAESTKTPTQPAPTLTATVQGSSGLRRGEAPIVAGYFSESPVIDGDFNEWSAASYSVDAVVYGSENWTGSADLSAVTMLGWDVNNLYLSVQISDDVFAQHASGIDIWKGDYIEILLDTKLDDDFYEERLSVDDYQLGLSPGYPAGNGVEAFLWFPSSKQGSRPQVQIASLSTITGYQVEAAIAWTVFNVTPEAGKYYGFAVSVSDNDRSGEVVQQSMSSVISTRRLTNPTTWGDLLLSKP